MLFSCYNQCNYKNEIINSRATYIIYSNECWDCDYSVIEHGILHIIGALENLLKPNAPNVYTFGELSLDILRNLVRNITSEGNSSNANGDRRV